METSPEPGVRSIGTQRLPHPTDASIEAMGPGRDQVCLWFRSTNTDVLVIPWLWQKLQTQSVRILRGEAVHPGRRSTLTLEDSLGQSLQPEAPVPVGGHGRGTTGSIKEHGLAVSKASSNEQALGRQSLED